MPQWQFLTCNYTGTWWEGNNGSFLACCCFLFSSRGPLFQPVIDWRWKHGGWFTSEFVSLCPKVECLCAVPVWSPVLLPVRRVCERSRSPRRQTEALAESPLLLWVRTSTCIPHSWSLTLRLYLNNSNLDFMFVLLQIGSFPRIFEFHLYDLVWKCHRLCHRSPVWPCIFRQKVRCLSLKIAILELFDVTVFEENYKIKIILSQCLTD